MRYCIDVQLKKYVFTFIGPTCGTSIESSSPPHSPHFAAWFILTDECETGNLYQFFLTPDYATDGFLVLDVGCQGWLSNVEVKNTHNQQGQE